MKSSIPLAGCVTKWETLQKPCEIYTTKKQYAISKCNLITDSNGPFAKCHKNVVPTHHHTMCLQDTCKMNRGYCDVMSAYAKSCIDAGVMLPNWRDQTTDCSKGIFLIVILII